MKNTIQMIHDCGLENRKELLNSKNNRCVCYYCNERYNVDEIDEWISDYSDDTAVCPKCGSDSVVPEFINEQYVTDEDIKAVYNKFFKNSFFEQS